MCHYFICSFYLCGYYQILQCKMINRSNVSEGNFCHTLGQHFSQMCEPLAGHRAVVAAHLSCSLYLSAWGPLCVMQCFSKCWMVALLQREAVLVELWEFVILNTSWGEASPKWKRAACSCAPSSTHVAY